MRSRGFTLIELLIVVAIIAILAAIAVPNFLEAQTRAKVSRTKADMRSLATGMEAYRLDWNAYPISIKLNPQPPWLTVIGIGPSVFNPNINGVSARLIPLTTPISYLTSVFPEVFRVQGVAATGAVGGGAEQYDTFDYVQAKEFQEGTMVGGGRGSGLTSGGAWRLASVGPDRFAAFGGRSLAEGPGETANEFGADYDPTNGSVSAGDVVRIGGSAPGVEPFYDRLGDYSE